MSWVSKIAAAGTAALCLLAYAGSADAADEQQSLEVLRNTVVNLLQALVDQGLMTHEKAEQLVRQAQDKAAASSANAAKAAAANERVEEGAIRVPYVPQIVKDEIGKQVAADLRPLVVADVIDKARTDKWGVPGALPDWVSRVRLLGDVTLRAQGDMYPHDNVQNAILDFNAINQAGGISKAGFGALLNVSQDRQRLRARARLGAEASLTNTLKVGVRLSSGSLTDPGSETQTLGNSGARYTLGIDQAYIRWDSAPPYWFVHESIVGGRFANPWFSPTELVFARDLQFEGLAETSRLGLGNGAYNQSNLFLTLGAFPIQEYVLANKNNKWLLGGQLGGDFRLAETQRLKIAAGLYEFRNVTGKRNATDSTLLNYTAPAFIRYGNSVFDISNSSTDSTVNLFALAAHFRLVDVSLSLDVPVSRYTFTLFGEGVRNIGYKERDILALTGASIPAKTKGYVAELSFGDPSIDKGGQWRTRLGYRYVERDALIDAWTDTDFHGGGTNAQGYYVSGEVGIANRTSLRLRYLSANEIDGLKYALDTAQLDLSARF